MNSSVLSILQQLKLVIFDSEIDRNLVEYDARILKEHGNHRVAYYIRLKDHFDLEIIEGVTSSDHISSREIELAVGKLKAFNLLKDRLEEVDMSTFDIYGDARYGLYNRACVNVKDTNVLFFPNEHSLVLIKHFKVMSDFDDQVFEHFSKCYKRDVSNNDFNEVLAELKEIDTQKASDLFKIEDAV